MYILASFYFGGPHSISFFKSCVSVHFYAFLFPTGSVTHMGNLKTAPVRPSVRPSSDLRDYLLDLFHIWGQLRHISGVVAHCFGILKKSKMADLRPFFVFEMRKCVISL